MYGLADGARHGDRKKRRLQLAAAVKIFGKRLENGIFVLFCQINLNKSTAFNARLGQIWVRSHDCKKAADYLREKVKKKS